MRANYINGGKLCPYAYRTQIYRPIPVLVLADVCAVRRICRGIAFRAFGRACFKIFEIRL